MKAKNRGMVLGILLALSARWADAAMELAPPAAPPIKIGGFVQSWLTAGNSAFTSGGGDYSLAGDLLRHLRLRFQADPLDGLQVIVIPELTGAAGFVLLDGYVSMNFDQVLMGETVPGEVSLTAGQFKTPFGLNRMSVPQMLTGVEYSTISNAIFTSTSFWDEGLMGTYKGKAFKLDLAAIKGLGPNRFAGTAPFGLFNMSQDYCGRLEVPLMDGQILIGGSYYYGYHFTGAGGTAAFSVAKNFFGAFFKLKGLPKTYELEGEWISRESEMFGVNAVGSFWLSANVQPFLLYEYVENHVTGTASTGRMGGGLNWYPRTAGPLRITLEVVGERAGYLAGDPASLNSGKSVLQTQVIF